MVAHNYTNETTLCSSSSLIDCIGTVSIHVNLLELSRYAKKHGKKLIDLTSEEVKKFSI